MTLRLNGSSSGYIELDAPAAAGSNTITLPTSNGSANQFLKNSGTAGELQFSSMVEDSSGNLGLGGITSPTWASDGGIHLGDDYGIGFGDGGSGRPDFQVITAGDGRLDLRCGFGADDADISIDSSGNLGLGTTSPSSYIGGGENLVIAESGDAGLTIATGTSSTGTINFADGTSGDARYRGRFEYSHSLDALDIITAATTQMRITSAGSVRIGKTDNLLANSGHVFDANGIVNHTRSGGVPVSINRTSSDGTLIDFYQDTSVEGNITVSGSTVSYNGGHLSRWSQLASGAERIEILRGSVLSNLDEMCEWAYEAQDAVLYTDEDELPEGVSVGDVKTPAVAAGTEDNEQLNRMKVSDVEGDPNVAGVFQAWDDDDDTYTNDFYCAMTGDFVIRIAQGTTVARGDLLMSAGDGTAKPQDDDIVRSKTIAKVTSTTVSTTYTDGSYCVPCVLMAC